MVIETVVKVVEGELYVGRTHILSIMRELGAVQNEMKAFGLKQSGNFRDLESPNGNMIPTMGFKLSLYDRLTGVPKKVRKHFEM